MGYGIVPKNRSHARLASACGQASGEQALEVGRGQPLLAGEHGEASVGPEALFKSGGGPGSLHAGQASRSTGCTRYMCPTHF